MSQSHRDKISEALKGKHQSPSTQFKKGHQPFITKPWLGKKFSKETRKRMSLSRIGKPNFRYKTMGRFRNSNGYILIYSPFHPFNDRKKYVLEHRLVMEKKLGRYLKKSEEVHHINGITDDNRPENLKLFNSKSKHIQFHKLNAKF